MFAPTLWQCWGHGNEPFVSLNGLNTCKSFVFLPSSRTDNTCFSSLDLFSQPWGKPLPIITFFQVDHHIDHGSGHLPISSRGEIVFHLDVGIRCTTVQLQWLQTGMGIPQVEHACIRLQVCVDAIYLGKLNARRTWTRGARSLPCSSLFFQAASGSTLGLHG